MLKAVICILFILSLTGCVAQEEVILPSKYQRISQSDAYKSCVASATNRLFDETTTPETIVRNSLAACSHFKSTMLSAYPQRWRENYIKDVDAELYQREVKWIEETRSKKNRFFR